MSAGESQQDLDSEHETEVYRFGDWQLDPRIARLSRAGEAVEIEPRVLRLLQVLVEERDRLVEKEELLDRVWEGAYVSDNALTRAAARLRNVLGDEARAPRFVQTVHRKGYRFIAAVEVVPGARRPQVADVSPTFGKRGWSRFGARAVAVVFGVLAVIALVVWQTRSADRADISAPAAVGREASPSAEPQPLDVRRIAVLPLDHVGPDDAEAYLAEGFTEQLVSVLARIDGLRVVARASTRAHAGPTSSARVIGRELGAGSLLEGSVRTGDKQLRIALRLVDAATEELRWSREFDTAVEDLLAVQTEIAVQVAEALETAIEPTNLRGLALSPTADATAYDLYLRGRRAYRQRTHRGNEEAIHRYRQALAIDPGFALAEAGLANAYALRVMRWGFPDQWIQRAAEAAQRSIALQADLPQSYKALAMVASFEGRFGECLELNLKALDIDPDFDEVLYNAAAIASLIGRWDVALELQSRDLGSTGRSGLPSYLFQLGFDAAGEAVSEQVLAEAPLSGYTQLNLAFRDMVTGELESARARLSTMREAYPDWPRVWRQSAEVEIWSGDLDVAMPYLEEAIDQVDGDLPEAQVRLAWLLARRGRQAEAEALLASVESRASTRIDAGSEAWSYRWLMAAVAAVREADDEVVVDWLDEAFALGFNLVRLHRSDPHFAAYRDTAGFRALTADMEAQIASMRRAGKPVVVSLGLPVD